MVRPQRSCAEAVGLGANTQARTSREDAQSVIRGGHSWLRLRIWAHKPLNHGDRVNALIALNQDTLDRHLQELVAGGAAPRRPLIEEFR